MQKDLIKWASLLAVLVILALVFSNSVFYLITAIFFSIFAISWSVFTSYSGYLNLGHVIFIGLAGYISAIFNYHLDFPLYLCIPIGIVAGTALGWLFFYPIHKKISGLTFEMVTFLSIVALTNLILSSHARPITGADLGLAPLDTIFSTVPFAITLSAILCLAGFAYARFLKSDSGKVIDFAREHQDLVRTAGASPHRYTGKLLFLSGIVAATGGALYVHYSGAAVVSNTVHLSFMIKIVIIAIIGGRYKLFGSVLGAFLVVYLGFYLKEFVTSHIENMIIYGLGLLIYFAKPGGLAALLEGLGRKLYRPGVNREST